MGGPRRRCRISRGAAASARPGAALDAALQLPAAPQEQQPPASNPSGNSNVGPESPGVEPMNRAAAEEASSGTESCGNSSPEPEEPGELLCMGGSKEE
ncbi:hypothetical protein DUI87_19502 [Hirundo rustica rustica]|uniref:Uncharacterized protein n=1 Tax=Hirundo rustica rustica TaxID=333673 RepID=A0A3M0JY28_HIRRU|nr:hypothetical protein DUI87_19502 [Hirundo rustica rustica]